MLLILIKASLLLSTSNICNDKDIPQVNSAFPVALPVRKPCVTVGIAGLHCRPCVGSCLLPACSLCRAGLALAARAAAVTCSIPANSQRRRTGKSTSAFHQSDLCLRCSSRLKDIFKRDLNVNSSASRAFTMGMKGRTKLTRACYEFGTGSVLMKAHRTAVEGSATWAFVDIQELKYIFLGASNISSPEKESGDYAPPLCHYQVSSCQSR